MSPLEELSLLLKPAGGGLYLVSTGKAEQQALMHAETVLLVDDGQSEVMEGDALLEQRMGADDDVDLAIGQAFQHLPAAGALLAAGEQSELEAGLVGQRRQAVPSCSGATCAGCSISARICGVSNKLGLERLK